MLLLFTPLMRLRIINSEIVPRDICRQAADALRDIIRSYSELYSLRRTPTFIPYFAVNSTIIHFALSLYNKPSGYSTAISDASNVNLPKSAPAYTHQRAPSNDAQASTSMSKSINESIANLLEMKHCHHSAAQAFQTLRYLANKWQLNVNITWPKIVFDESVNKSPQPINGTLDSVATDVAGNNSSCVCGAEMYTKEPSPEVHAVRGQNPTFIENGDLTAFADDIGENLQKYAEESGTATETMLKADGARSGVENPLFWPFPIQRRPMLLSGPLLAKAGFTLA